MRLIYYEKEKYFENWAKKFSPKPRRELPELFKLSVQTRFQTVIEDLEDTSYADYWEKEVGRRRYVGPLPFPLFTPLHTITYLHVIPHLHFDKPTSQGLTMKELLNYCGYLNEEAPLKKPDSIQNKCAVFAYNPHGKCMKRCLTWVKKLIVAGSIQADFHVIIISGC